MNEYIYTPPILNQSIDLKHKILLTTHIILLR